MFKDLAVGFLLCSRKIEILEHPDKQDYGKREQERSDQDQGCCMGSEKMIEKIAQGVAEPPDHKPCSRQAGKLLAIREVREQKDPVYGEEPEGQIVNVPQDDVGDRFTGKGQHEKRRHKSGQRAYGSVPAAPVIEKPCADQACGIDQAGQLDTDAGMNIRGRKSESETLDKTDQKEGAGGEEQDLPVEP